MTEIFNRRNAAQAKRTPVRALAVLAAATTIGGVLPLLGATPATAAAAASCGVPTNLAPNTAPTATSPELKDVILTWSGPSDAPVGTKYDLEISSDQDYATNLSLNSSTTSTRFVVPVLALPHGTYFWRVRVDGRSCWSDDAGAAAEFTSGWRARPTLTFPANGGTVAAPDLRFSWQPVPEASSYLLDVFNSSGAPVGSCVTEATTFTPYDVPANGETEAERLTKNAACDVPLLASGSYSWSVRALDDTAVTDNTTPYKGVYGVPPLPGATAAHDASTPGALASDVGAPAYPSSSFTVSGSPAATSSSMGVNASLVNPDGQTFTNCDVADITAACPTTPTIRWTPVSGASRYRVTLATDQHFTNSVRVYDTAYDNITPLDALLDSQAGQAYFIRVCSDTNVCTAVDNDSPENGTFVAAATVPSFRKKTAVVGSLGVLTSSTLTAAAAQVTLGWADPAATNAFVTSPADYEVQVANSCDFDSILFSYTTDVTQQTDVFPAGAYYWRVRSVDASGSPGPWSVGNSDTPLCGTGSANFAVVVPLTSIKATTASGATPSVTVDVTSASVKKSGYWVKRNAHGASSGSALVTGGTKKQYLTYVFTASSVTVNYCKGPTDGYFSVYVDGKMSRTINSYQPFTSCGKTFTVPTLSNTKPHKLVVQASNKKGSAHGASQLVVDYFQLS